MSVENPTERTDPGPAGAPGAPPPEGNELIGSLKQFGDELSGLLRDATRLLGAESKLFVSSLLLIAILAVLAGFVLAGAVAFLGVAAVLLLVQYGGLPAAGATLLVVLGLLVVAIALFFWIRALTRNLKFSHSRRMFSEFTERKPTEDEA